MELIGTASPPLDTNTACEALCVPRANYYRWLNHEVEKPSDCSRKSPRALNESERSSVLEVLHSERFVDKTPAETYATLLDEGEYLCSVRTMYRILDQEDEVRERRKHRRHKNYKKPELLATAPNQVWTWDITKLKGPQKWTYYYLYVILDIFSRYVVGWMVAPRESAMLASRLINESCFKQGIQRDQLTVHADRGPSMKAKLITQLLADLSITKSHSRPYVSNDNPFSEAHFKTVKYNPWFPERFGCQEDALAYCRYFFNWYNNEHRHSGIGFITPRMVHYGEAEQITEKRRAILLAAYNRHPERFVRKLPEPPVVPNRVWINPPKIERENETQEKDTKL